MAKVCEEALPLHASLQNWLEDESDELLKLGSNDFLGKSPPHLLVVFQVFKLFLFFSCFDLCEISSLNCPTSYNPWSKGWLPRDFLQAAAAHWNSHAGLTAVATFGHHARALSK